jgi:hypothetical protein
MGEMRRGWRLLVWGVLVPLGVAIADYGLIDPARRLIGDYPCAVGVFFVLAGQLAGWNCLVGRLVAPGALRWVLFGWGIALANLLVLKLNGSLSRILGGSFISAELGLLVGWGALGAVRWPWRIPGVVVTVTLLSYWTSLIVGVNGQDWWPAVWLPALALQCFGMVSIGLALRLKAVIAIPEAQDSKAQSQRPQFTLRDLLLWFVLVIPLLTTIPRLTGGPDPTLVRQLLLPAVAVGLGLCLLTWVAVWAVLSMRPLIVRGSVLVVVTSVVGGWMYAILTTWTPRYAWPPPDYGDIWFAWAALLACFTIGLALPLHASGYRLVKYGSPSPPPTEPVSQPPGWRRWSRWLFVGGAVLAVAVLVLPSVSRVYELRRARATIGKAAEHAGGTFFTMENRIDFYGKEITDENLRRLEIRPEVEGLLFMSTRVTGTGFQGLAGREHLKKIEIQDSPVTDEGLKALEGFDQLEELIIHSADEITEDGAASLVRLRNLKRLFLRNSKISEEGMARLREAMPNCAIAR